MYRTFFVLSAFVVPTVFVFWSVDAQESPSHEPEQTVVVKDTGGEWENAARPDIAKAAASIVEQTNSFRKEQNRKPVSVNKKLTEAAQDFADYMAKTGRYGHTADGSTPAERVKAADYEFCTVRENIAYAFRSKGFSTDELADQFFSGWKHSPGHRRNMLAKWVVDTGVAIAKSQDTDTYFAVQVFGRPESQRVTFEIANRSEVTVDYRVEDQRYSVEPRVVRTHATCNPVQLSFMPLVSKDENSHPVRPVQRIDVKGGETMAIESTESSYRVVVETPAKAPPNATPEPDR